LIKVTGSEEKMRRVLLVVQDEKVKELTSSITESSRVPLKSLAYYNLDGYYGFFDENGRLKKKVLNPENLADGISKAVRVTCANDVFIAHPISYDTLIDTMLKLRQQDKVKFMASPEAYEACMGWVGRNASWILPAVDFSTGNVSPFYWIIKRCIDILLSVCAVIFLFPFFVIIPMLIKLTSRGPVFFTQVRCGHNGRPFKIYKFRTMVADAEKLITKIIDFEGLKEPVFKLKNDPRVTPIGKILRKTSIDELPQLFNVIKGDLSLVGPRPEEIALVQRYNSYFKQRLKVKPGITGLQQVNCRGTTKMMERMKYDLAYMRSQSFWLDLKILFKTVSVVLLQKRAA